MKKYLLLALPLFFIALNKANAQQDPLFSHYMFNKLYYNPAYSGVNGDMDFGLTYRQQWVGYESSFDEGGSPGTGLFSVGAPIYSKKQEFGMGGLLMFDRYGFTQDIHFHITPSWHKDLGPGKFSVGLKIGGIMRSVDFTKARLVDPDDPLVPTTQESLFGADLGLGVWYETPKYFGGIAVNHLLPSSFDFGVESVSGQNTNSEAATNELVPHYNIIAGVNIELNYEFMLTPSLIFQSSEFNQNIVEGTVLGTYQDRFWGGVSYRSTSDLVALVGAGFMEDNVLRVGLAFDIGLSQQKNDALRPISPEIYLTYKIPQVGARKKPIVRTPRYRF